MEWEFISSSLAPMLGWFALMAALFTVLASLSPCNKGYVFFRKGWWVDCAYYFTLPFVTRYVRLLYLSLFFGLFYAGFTDEELTAYLKNGYGFFGSQPLWIQALLILLVSDFMLYWFHRWFHTRSMWRFHAVHHSSEEIDWLSAYRFHPINTWFSFTIVDVVMLGMGFSPAAFAVLAPFNIMFSGFVHANLNWTFGPFKYVLASPVFHRWHHTHTHEGGSKNFAPTFPFIDWMFGTFYMPEGKLPEVYGVEKRDVPENFVDQMLYPFRKR